MKLALALFAASLLVTVRAADSAGAYPPLKYQPLCSHGQALVDMEMARHPELKLITVHITPLGVPADANAERRILCSSIGRFGKPDAGPDAEVFNTNAEQVEIDKKLAPGANPFGPTAAPKYEVMAPLYDQAGDKIGIIVVVFPWKAGDDVAQKHATALKIRDEFKERTASKDDLLRPAE